MEMGNCFANEEMNSNLWKQTYCVEKDLEQNLATINDCQYLLNKCESNRFWAGIMTILVASMWVLAIVALWILALDQDDVSTRNAYFGIAAVSTFGGFIAFVAAMIWSFSSLPIGQQYVTLGSM